MSQLLINQYLTELANLKRVSGASRESVVREAFKDLLKAWGRSQDLTFIPEHEFITTAKVRNYVDGALMHDLRVPFGYWEAKDEADDLDVEIQKKFRRGYPNTNIIFEDSTKAVLIQNGVEVMRCATDGPELQRLLELFFAYQRPEIADFRKAIVQFKTDLPAVLEALRGRVDDAYAKNEAFAEAAKAFLKSARQTINKTVEEADVREMLIQHILTEEIFSHVFGADDFHHDNNVAKTLYALEKLFFRGDIKRQTLNALEPYYAAIRSTAALISSHSEKQGFLKAIYENFYKVYNAKAADRLGVVYTPNEIVRFMVESTDWLCEKHFGKSLVDKGVDILDPATGTGTFVVEMLEHFRGQPEKLKHKYAQELHANEVAILPYYVANLNIEATYAAIAGAYVEFPGLCFVDTLDNVAALGKFSGFQDDLFAAISDENVERVKRQNTRTISVVIGNPPYNAWQENFNQNNANRYYERVDQRIADTYVRESSATNSSSVYDMYTRFLRWASDRVNSDGVIAFVIGRKPFTKGAYDGFRKIAEREFEEVWIVDLGGDVRDNPRLSGTKHNVFGIQTGVAICFLVKRKGKGGAKIRYTSRPEYEIAEDKLALLSSARGIADLKFEILKPDSNHNWLNLAANEWEELIPLITKSRTRKVKQSQASIFQIATNGLQTKRDDWVYGRRSSDLRKKVEWLVHEYQASIDNSLTPSENMKWDRELSRHLRNATSVSFSDQKIRPSLYRPYSKRLVYFDPVLNSQMFRLQEVFPGRVENSVIDIGNFKRAGFGVVATDQLPTTDMFLPDVGLCFPRYRYVADQRLENVSDWAVAQFSARYKGVEFKVSKDDIFAYVYAVLHDPVYRHTYAVNLKRGTPRIPLYDDFKRWRDWGQELLVLHIGYEAAKPFDLTRNDAPDRKAEGTGTTPAVKLKSDRDNGVIVLDTETTLSGVPASAWDYKLGNRSAIDWVLDQHKEKTPKDPTVREKFNTYRFADHKEAVVELLKRVTTVSVRTVEIVEAMRGLKRAPLA